MAISAASVSALLRRIGFGNVSQDRNREGIRVSGGPTGDVSVRVDLDSVIAAKRMADEVEEALKEAGRTVERYDDNSMVVTATNHRRCESCGGAMPQRTHRQRNQKGQLVCDSCAPSLSPSWGSSLALSASEQAEVARRESEAVHSVLRVSRRTTAAEEEVPLVDIRVGDTIKPRPSWDPVKVTEIWPNGEKGVRLTFEDGNQWTIGRGVMVTKISGFQTVAHDSGDNALIHHCPFCGSGAVTGRSDSSAECDFCHSVFTVQVQPAHPNMPQTVNGEPVTPPGMPGGEETELSAPVDPAVEETEDGVAANPLDEEDPFGAPQSVDKPVEDKPKGNQPPWLKNKKSSRVSATGRPAIHPLSDEVGKRCSWCGGEDPDRGSTQYSERFDSPTCRKAYWEWVAEDGDFGSPPSPKQAFRTSTGATLPLDDYIAHLALSHADDREAVLDSVRVANVQRQSTHPDYPHGVPYQCEVCGNYRNREECVVCDARAAETKQRGPSPLDYLMFGLFPSGATASKTAVVVVCPECNGAGVDEIDDVCWRCNGDGTVDEGPREQVTGGSR